MSTEVIIISGTFAPPFAIQHFPYSTIIKFFEELGYKVHMESIRLLGIGRMENALERIEQKYFLDSPSSYILVGHSQGGLLALSLASEYPQRVESVEIFGSPLYGTRMAPIWLPFPAIRAMNYRSRWLKQLRYHDSLNVHKVHSYFSALDALVVPWVASMVKSGNNHLLVPGAIRALAVAFGKAVVGDRMDEVELISASAGHIGMLMHPAVIDNLRLRYSKAVTAN